MFPYTDNPPLESKKHQNPISKPHDPFLSNFFFDQHQLPLNHIFPPSSDNIIINSSSPKNLKDKAAAAAAADPPISNGHVAPPRRRNLGPRKKDRHSKIRTAQGVRDRRMRLSLQVARKFFDLQDMLGYDKASKTIEWLFCKSKKAIKELTKQGNACISLSESLVSECDQVVSGVEENSTTIGGANPKKKGQSSKIPYSRESRARARARARCRTMEKMMIRELRDQERVLCAPDYSPVEDVGTIEKLLGNYQSSAVDATNSFMGFLGNWDVFNNDKIQLAAVTNQVGKGNSTSIYSPTASDFPFLLPST